MDQLSWGKLWKAVTELQDGFEPGAVFIGGVAVFAHTKSSQKYSAFVEFSHDADLMISVADYTDLKDIEQVVPNRRLSKAQFYKSGFEFDVYVEGQSGLIVPYDEAAAHSEVVSGIRVACLEHLLILKLKAFEDRRGSAKGDKDENDVLKILMLLADRELQPERVARLSDELAVLMDAVTGSNSAVRVAEGNMHLASQLRKAAEEGASRINEARGAAMKCEW